MMNIKFDLSKAPTVLCIGAHCDDIEIGCAGTLLELARRYPDARFHWVIFGGEDVREQESRNAARALLGDACNVDIQRFRGSYLPYHGAEVKDYFESVAQRVSPDLVLTHYLYDRHQDHRLLGELTWNTFRRHTVLEYEIPKYEGDLGHPALYVPLERRLAERKVDVLLESFPSQLHRPWFTRDLFMAHLRLRGIECHAPAGLAEAFHARKLTM